MKRNYVMSILKKSAYFLAAALLFTSCGSDDEEKMASIETNDAILNFASNNEYQMIMSVRVGDLIDKSGLNDDLLPAEVKGMASIYIDQFLDESKTGLDLDKPAYIIMDMSKIGRDGNPNLMTFVISLSDGEKFQSLLESKGQISPEEGEGYKYAVAPTGMAGLAWTNSMLAVFVGDDMRSGTSDKIKKMMATVIEKGKGKTKDLEKFLKNKSDFGIYMDYQKYMNVMKSMPGVDKNMISLEMFEGIFKDSYAAMYLDFDKGKVTLDTEFKGSKEFEKFMKTMYKDGNPEYASLLGGENLIGFGTMSFNIDELLAWYEKTGFFETASVKSGMEEMKNKAGFDIRDILNKFSGDVSFALVGMNVSEGEKTADNNPYAGYYDDQKETMPVMTFAVGIKDSTLATIFDTVATLTKKDNMYIFPATEKMKFGGLCFKKGVLFVSTDQALLEDFAMDGRLNTYTKNNAKESIAKNSMYAYFDFKAFSDVMTDVDAEVATAVSALDFAELSVNRNNMSFKGTLHLVDKNTNSLKALLKMIIASSDAGRMF